MVSKEKIDFHFIDLYRFALRDDMRFIPKQW